jgi:colanic acid/amylovoran biosynthesis glycosyltransferase
MNEDTSSTGLRILTIASLDWRNGHEYALQAALILKQRKIDFEYRIVGDGNFLEAVTFARHELGLHDQVCLTLVASPTEIDRMFTWADVFLIMAVKAGAANDLASATRRGISTIISDLPEFVEEYAEKPGIYIVPRRNPAALAEKLAQFACR